MLLFIAVFLVLNAGKPLATSDRTPVVTETLRAQFGGAPFAGGDASDRIITLLAQSGFELSGRDPLGTSLTVRSASGLFKPGSAALTADGVAALQRLAALAAETGTPIWVVTLGGWGQLDDALLADRMLSVEAVLGTIGASARVRVAQGAADTVSATLGLMP